MISGKEDLRFANESVNKLAEAAIAAYVSLPPSSPDKKNLEDVAEIITSTINVADGNNLQKNLEALTKKVENSKNRSSIVIKVKEWARSLIKFLKFPFSKPHQEELKQTEEDFLKALEVIRKIYDKDISPVQEQISTSIPAKKTEVLPSSLVETQQKSHVTTDTTEPIVVHETTHLTILVQEKGTLPNDPVTPPPAPAPPPPPPPPPPSPLHSNVVLQQISQADLLAAITKGNFKLNKVEDRTLNELPADQADDPFMNELQEKLVARRGFVEGQGNKKVSPTYAKDAAEFERLGREEEARQKRQEEIDAPRIEAALKEEVEKRAAAEKILSPPKAQSKLGEIPLPPPPPLSSPSTNSLPNIKKLETDVEVSPTTKPQTEQKRPEFVVGSADIINALAGLRKAATSPQKETEVPTPNLGVKLKQKTDTHTR
ncbi:MAG: hypothetical protein DMENIID0002_04690 [Rickettsia endosymbiont of Sergentomyia squamirostris]|uniref:WH2 domain-containing protein n=1 Tax=Candidatus Tisiphia endosymbiont of Sergentomyia squamirostris TaxID=3113639 RepID=A0AAT9G7S4_9RICK